MLTRIPRRPPLAALLLGATLACATTSAPGTGAAGAAASTASAVKPWFVRTGFVAPEAVRYDPDQDVYFVGNWGTGSGSATDNNG